MNPSNTNKNKVLEWNEIRQSCLDFLKQNTLNQTDSSVLFLRNYITTLDRKNDASGDKLLKLLDMIIRTASTARNSYHPTTFGGQANRLSHALYDYMETTFKLDINKLRGMTSLNQFKELPFKDPSMSAAYQEAYKDTEIKRAPTQRATGLMR